MITTGPFSRRTEDEIWKMAHAIAYSPNVADRAFLEITVAAILVEADRSRSVLQEQVNAIRRERDDAVSERDKALHELRLLKHLEEPEVKEQMKARTAGSAPDECLGWNL